MKKQLLSYCILLFCLSASAQTVLLNVDTREQQRKTDFGPNLKRFTHLKIHMGALVSGDKPGASIKYGESINLSLGLRVKYKITNVYSLGYEIDAQYLDYKFKQENGKRIPDTIIYNTSQRLDYSSLTLGFYNRFNFDPSRGNYLGKFVDLGINGSFDYSIKKISKSEEENGTHVKNIVSHLPFVNKFNVNTFFRLGTSHLSLFGSYRLTDLFKSSYDFPELPRLIVGFEIALF